MQHLVHSAAADRHTTRALLLPLLHPQLAGSPLLLLLLQVACMLTPADSPAHCCSSH
jgi:hypothetical protein